MPQYREQIRVLLETQKSKSQRNEVIAFVGTDPEKMEDLMHFFFHENWRYNQWSAWPLGFIGRRHPTLVRPYLKRMVHNLDVARHDAVIRNTVRVFEDISIPEELEGILYDKCFAFLANPKQSIAIRAFSMTVLYKITLNYPELAPELIAEIREHLPYGSAGFQNRGKKIIAKLEKLI